jgi:hypothetical protein
MGCNSSRYALQKYTPASLLAGVLFCAQIGATWQHPADEGRMETVFRVVDGRLTWTQSWWFGNVLGQSFWASVLDADRDAALSAAERDAFATRVIASFPVELDGAPVDARVDALEIAAFNDFIALPADPQIRVVMSAPLRAERARLVYRKRDADPLSFLPRFPGGDGVLIRDQDAGADRYAATFQLRAPVNTGAAAARAQTARIAAWVAVAALTAAALVAVLVITLLIVRRRRGARSSAPR